MQTLSPTTELDAVNIMLSSIGESPVNSLTASESNVEVSLARQILREVATQVQEPGWHWNTEVAWIMQPTADTQEIFLPANCIEIDSSGVSEDIDVVSRGNRLYNRTTHSYTFDQPITVDMTILLAYEEMPQAARHYIAIRASRVYQRRILGSESINAFTEADETVARAALKRLENKTGD